ncbi:MAG: oligosaccharide flippase family protein [Planctomycetota bacterium]
MKRSDDLIKHGSLMFLAVAIFNIFSLLYQLYMVRNLSPTNYGVLNSLFSILMIISVPSGTLRTVVTKFISTFYAINHHERINLLLRSFVKKASVVGLVIFLMLILGSRVIASFLQVTSPLLIVILAVIAFLSFILPLTQGGLQGLQRFGYLGLTMITNGSIKLLLGIIFVSAGFGVIGAMGALAISTFVTLLLSVIMLASVLPRPLASITESRHSKSNNTNPKKDSLEIYRYFYAVATVFLCFMILTNIDVVLVKHFFKPLEAGYYSIAQMVGKIILFLPVAITLVMFPKTSELHAQDKATFHILKKSLLYVGALCVTAALICILFPGLIIRLLSGEEHLHCIPLARIFSVTMVFFALVYVLLFYHLSIHHLGFIYPLVLFTILQTLAISIFHQTLSQVLYIMCGNAVLLFLINAYLAFKREERHVASDIGCNS